MSNTPAKHEVALAQSPISTDAVFLLRKLGALGSIDANRKLEGLNLKVRSYSALSLACSPTPPTQRELAEILTLDPSQIVPIVDDLEAKGLVERTPNPADRRAKLIEATSTGRKLATEAQQAINKAQDETLAALSSEERQHLTNLLFKAVFNPTTRS